MHKTALIIAISFATQSFAQTLSKECFNASGKPDEEKKSEYCVAGKRVLRIDEIYPGSFDTVETFIDTVAAYYVGTNSPKFIKLYNKQGFQDGGYVEYYPDKKVKERGIYKNGRPFGSIFRYYASGKLRSIMEYSANAFEIGKALDIDFRILDYWDSAGNQIVKKGNGYCDCFLESGRREVGKVVNGLRDSIWSEYSGDTLIIMEHYFIGRFVEGVRNYKGNSFKYRSLESQPEYAAGFPEMMKAIYQNLRYPEKAMTFGIEGVVVVSFMVTKDGAIQDTQVKHGLIRECDVEAMRVVKLLKTWYPGMQRGAPMNARFNLPVKFAINYK